ncbi:uncharacterized protein LOC113279792 [Papaver somniferum]|uniref:uncharacterized protein LOC113279792 n=1 Tax=Papaver somniferum TaxID=3469 RepID=UPI000E6FA86B|nr:uncharacterized protein LOC113279792 [Papaver somniferum]
MGIKDLRCTDTTLKAKWVWRYSRKNRVLWRRVVLQIFNNNPYILIPTDVVIPKGRSVWKKIINTTSTLHDHIDFKLNIGKGIQFWMDNWCSTGLLKDIFPAIYKVCRRKQASISDMVVGGRLICDTRTNMSSTEQLDWDRICSELGQVHGLTWVEDNMKIKGGCTVKNCYEMQIHGREEDEFYKHVWRKSILSKVSFMLWAHYHSSLPTLSMPMKPGVEVHGYLC